MICVGKGKGGESEPCPLHPRAPPRLGFSSGQQGGQAASPGQGLGWCYEQQYGRERLGALLPGVGTAAGMCVGLYVF